ncbi:hypothetical protein Tco_0948306, partial [Tanacetum coccineum]
MQKYILKQQFEGFSVSNTEGLHKGYDRFQSLLSQLKIHGAGVSTEDANKKFRRSLPSAWSQVSLIMRTKPRMDNLSFDDLYNNLRVFESDVKGSTTSSSSTQNVAFVSENTSSINDVSTAYGVSNTSGQNSQYEQTSSYSLLANQSSCPQLDHEDLEQLDEYDLEEIDLKNGKKEESKALVTVDGEGVDWSNHSEENEDYSLMACNGSDSDTEITSCSTKCKESYANLKKLYDAQREQLSDASIEIKAYSQGLKKVEAQLVAHQQGQLWYEQKIKFMKIDLDDKTDVLTYHKKLLAEAQKEKDDLKAKVEKWHHSSKNLGKLLNSQMSAYDKFGLGYGDHRYNGVLSYENEVLQSVFKGKENDFLNPPLNDRLVKTGEMHAVPPPMTGNYMPSGPDIEVDYSQFIYGPKQTQPSESESQISEFDTCESNSSSEPSELVFAPVVNESNVECQPKVWSDAPIIEEYESDSEDECVSIPIKEKESPSFANQQVKTPRETAKEKRMARKAELNNGWNNVHRVNKQNQFVPSAVLTRTGKILVSTARTTSTKNFSTARQSFNRQTVLNCAVMNVNTVKPTVNRYRPANVFHKTHSPFSRPFKMTTILKTDFSNQKVNTAKDYPHRALKNKGIVDSGCSRHMTGNKAYLAEFQDFNGGPVAFGGSKGYITGKGKIKTGKLDFEDVCFVKELQNFNLFSVSQMCDKKNKVLFTDSECLVLSPEFKLPDDNQAQITKLKKQAKPVIKHHRAYLKSVSVKQRFPRKSFSKKHKVHKESVSKQGRKFAKGESSVQRDPLFDEMLEDTVDYMDTENAQDEWRTREVVDEDKEIEENELSTEEVLSTDKEGVSTDIEKVSTDRPIVSTDRFKVSTDKHIEGTDEQVEGTEEKIEGTDEQVEGTEEKNEGTEEHIEGTEEKVESTGGHKKGTEEEITPQATQTSTQTPTSMIFGDNETIAKVLLNMSQAKAVAKEKEKGVELKDVEETERP